MGKAFDAAKNDDSFYIPPEVFENEDFKRVMDIFLSPDGKAARMLISQRGDPASPEGVARVDPIKDAAEEALKGTPLESTRIYLAGTAATTKDIVEGSTYDLLIAAVSAICLIFIIMLHHDEKFCCRLGYRRYGGAFAGCGLRSVGSRLAVSSRHTNTLGGAGDGSDCPFGGRV